MSLGDIGALSQYQPPPTRALISGVLYELALFHLKTLTNRCPFVSHFALPGYLPRIYSLFAVGCWFLRKLEEETKHLLLWTSRCAEVQHLGLLHCGVPIFSFTRENVKDLH
eukprot:g41270.t1